MTTVSNATSVSPVTAADPTPAGLTAEGILAYCASRLNALDELINARFAEQKSRNAGLKEAGELMTKLNASDNGIAAGGSLSPKQQEDHKWVAADLANLYNRATNPDVKTKIAESFKLFTGKDLVVGNDGKAEKSQLNRDTVTLDLEKIYEKKPEAMQAFVMGVKQVQDNLTKDSELSMIQMQSTIAQRQQAVAMTTQLLQTINESAKQIIGNYR